MPRPRSPPGPGAAAGGGASSGTSGEGGGGRRAGASWGASVSVGACGGWRRPAGAGFLGEAGGGAPPGGGGRVAVRGEAEGEGAPGFCSGGGGRPDLAGLGGLVRGSGAPALGGLLGGALPPGDGGSGISLAPGGGGRGSDLASSTAGAGEPGLGRVGGLASAGGLARPLRLRADMGGTGICGAPLEELGGGGGGASFSSFSSAPASGSSGSAFSGGSGTSSASSPFGGGGGGSGTAPDKGNVFDASGGFSAWNPDKQGGRAKEQAEWSGDVPSGWGSSAPTGGAGTSSKAGASSQGGGQGGQGGGQGGPASNRKGRAGAGGKVEEDSNDFGFDPWQEMQRGFAELLVDAPSKEQDAGPSYGAWPGRKEHGRQPTQAQVAAAAGTGPGGRSRYDFAQDLSASGGGSSGGASANGGGSNGGSGGGPAANSDPEELHNAFRKLLPNVNVRFVETDGSSAAAKPSASNSEGASGVGSSASSVYGRQQAMPAVPPPPGIKWAGSQAQRPSYAMGSSWSPTGPYGGSSGGGGGQKGPPGLGTQPPPQWGQMAAPAMQRGGQAMPQFPPGIQRFSAQMSGQFPSHSTGAGDAYLQQKGWSTQPKIRPGTSQPYRQEPPHGHPMPSQSSASAALRDPAIVSAGAAGKSAWGDGRTPLPGNRLPPTAGYDYKRAYGQRPPGQQLPPGINPNAMPRRPAGPVQYSNYGPPGVARPPAKGPPPGLSKPQDPVSAQHQAQLYQQHQQRMASSASSSGMDGQQPQRQ
mmetsp:Transcript_20541/g.78723  ORF Transcript_20541/g.78723 Transcript_20541/m.78723 type:complete len:755 (+) Transcript_20541:530-2794(+)